MNTVSFHNEMRPFQALQRVVQQPGQLQNPVLWARLSHSGRGENRTLSMQVLQLLLRKVQNLPNNEPSVRVFIIHSHTIDFKALLFIQPKACGKKPTVMTQTRLVKHNIID